MRASLNTDILLILPLNSLVVIAPASVPIYISEDCANVVILPCVTSLSKIPFIYTFKLDKLLASPTATMCTHSPSTIELADDFT